MLYKKKDLPSFMRMKFLRQMEKENKLHYIYNTDGNIAGFYVLDGSMFKCLYINPLYRHQGLASRTISKVAADGKITIATLVKRKCAIKNILIRLNFKPTEQIVQGKQSKLRIWVSQ